MARTRDLINPDAKLIAYQRLNAAFVFEYERVIPRYQELSEVKQAMSNNDFGYVISRTIGRTNYYRFLD